MTSDCIRFPSLSTYASSQCPGLETMFAIVDAASSFRPGGSSRRLSRRMLVNGGRAPKSTRTAALSSKVERFFSSLRLAARTSNLDESMTTRILPHFLAMCSLSLLAKLIPPRRDAISILTSSVPASSIRRQLPVRTWTHQFSEENCLVFCSICHSRPWSSCRTQKEGEVGGV